LAADNNAGEAEDERTIVVEDQDGMSVKIFKNGVQEGALWIEEVEKVVEGEGDRV
jgi:hypothetical protein